MDDFTTLGFPPFYMRRSRACASYTRTEEAIQEGKDIGVIGRSFEAHKSFEGAGYRPETIERAFADCK